MKKSRFKKILSFFKIKKDKNKEFLKNLKSKKRSKKRNSFKISFKLKSRFNFFKKSHIPYFFISLCLIIFVSIWIFISPIFKLKYIEIIKKDSLTDMNIAYKSIESLRWKSIFDINKKDILEKLKSYQENIKDIKVKTIFPRTLYIEIESYKELFNIKIEDKNYLVLENGSFVAKNKHKNLDTLYIEEWFWKNKFLDFKKVFDGTYMKKIVKAKKLLKENILSTDITLLIFYNTERELHIEINNLTRIILSLDNDISIDEQIKKLAIFNKDYKNINKKDLIYIDLRIKNKIFFCEKEKQFQCYKNLREIYPKIDFYEENEEKKED